MDGGMVRCGVEVEGRPYIDDTFTQEAVPCAGLLVKLLHRAPLAAEEIGRLQRVPSLVRRTLCSLTARALRRIAALCDLTQLQVRDKPNAEPLAGLLAISFSPVELLLEAGRSRSIRYTDAAVRMYKAPPDGAEERWLFEWQLDALDCPWPVMTARQAECKIGLVTLFGQLGQSLGSYLVLTRRSDAPHGLCMLILHSEEHVYYLFSTDRYFTLLVYQQMHMGRVLKLFEDLIATDAEEVAASAKLPAPSAQSSLPSACSMSSKGAGWLDAAALPVPVNQPPASDRTLPEQEEPPPEASPPEQPEGSVSLIADFQDPPVSVSVSDGTAAIPPAVLWQHPDAILSLRGYGLKVGRLAVVSHVDLDIAPSGLHILIMPDGPEKRFLFRALCGKCPSQFEKSGHATYLGQELGNGEGPGFSAPEARFINMKASEYLTCDLPLREAVPRSELLTQATAALQDMDLGALIPRLHVTVGDLEFHERRALEILRAASMAKALLILDDPLGGLSPSAQSYLLSLLKRQAELRAVLIITANSGPFVSDEKAQKLALGRWIGGRIVDGSAAPLELISSLQPSEPERLEPAAPAQEAADFKAVTFAAPNLEAKQEPQASLPLFSNNGCGPRGFQWLRRGALAGMPAPGLSAELEYDLDLIRGSGVSWLVTLTTEPLPSEELERHGLRSLFFPIEDMDAPPVEAAAALCARVAALVQEGLAVGFHCRAGYGRTGTMLAAQLIWEGADARSALSQARHVEPNWVQSEKQVQFLFRFEKWLRDHRASQTPSS